MRNILGLDLGTNSIGWALIDADLNHITNAGSRIIPMDAATMGDYEKGNLKSSASERTDFRRTRRNYERAILRRERLLRVLNKMNFLPQHFKEQIDFDEHPGKFKNHGEPLLAYCKDTEGKSQFVFESSFKEMLHDFSQRHPEYVVDGKLIPHDWTIFYLRKKALHQAITKEELAWIILNFNTKRGYYQLRGKDEATANEEDAGKKEEYMRLKVAAVENIGVNAKKKGFYKYQITYENGATQEVSSPKQPRETGDIVDVIVTTTLDKDGSVKLSKDGTPLISLRTPKPDDWTLVKKRTEHSISQSGLTVGEYIYEHILTDPSVKVRGKLVHTIEREYYKSELIRILEKQQEFIPELTDTALYAACIAELYRNNSTHIDSIKNGGFTELLVDDIIFYQRPLKSKKSLIADCPFETYIYKDKDNTWKKRPIKCISKSHPIYEEFRLWQFFSNLRIFKRTEEVNGKLETDVDVTSRFISTEDNLCELFDWLMEKKEIKQEQLLKHVGIKKENLPDYRWNYVEDKTYPCCPTHYGILKCLAAVGVKQLEEDKFLKLWHILYSVDDPIMCPKALHKFVKDYNEENGNKEEGKIPNEEEFVKQFKNYSPDKGEYGAYSEKAIRRLLPLMRMGKYWREDAIDEKTTNRINTIIDGVQDESISGRTREKFVGKQSIAEFKGLPVWLAEYAVYDRHSESSDITRWEKPDDIDTYLRENFKQHSLRNPIVEKVIGETLRLVRDLWREYGSISEVHVEMGRSLKQDAESRKKDTQRMRENERTNLRIKLLLQEFKALGIEGIKPYSPSQQEILKIYENGVLNDASVDVEDDIKKMIDDLGNGKTEHINKKEVERYKMWLEQNYKSPYTGQPIPLSKLFTSAYEIEHVIPRSRFFDDSLSNKVICETEVNKKKGNMLGYEFIKEQGGSIIKCGNKDVTILDIRQYEEFVQKHYFKNRTKMRKLLMEEIPQGFANRQMNDTRYMSRKMISILSCLVREEGEQEATSKNVIATNGAITDLLKQEWGINEKWNELVAPRFQRLNEKTGTTDFGHWECKEGKRYFQTTIPLHLSVGFSKKRIDHRHHAMDAIIIACTNRSIINFLNNNSATSNKEEDRSKTKRDVFKKPWPTFTQDVAAQLSSVIVSFKQNLRIVTRANNHFTHYVNGQKVVEKQTKGDGWAIRKSMHKDTVSGIVHLQQKKTVRLTVALDNWTMIVDRKLKAFIADLIKQYHHYDKATLLRYFKDREYKFEKNDISKVDIYYYTDTADGMSATRTAIDDSFDEKKIRSISDTGIQKIMLAHLANSRNAAGKPDPKIAFSPEGIEEMNKNIKALNNGKDHKPIYKVRKTEILGMKFPVGETGNKKKKFVEADKGTNLFFAIYTDNEEKRSFESIPLNEAIERKKCHMDVADVVKPDGRKLLFILSPNDLVRVTDADGKEYIYKMVSCTRNRCFFVPCSFASLIIDKVELGTMNKIEITPEGINIKQECEKIIVDRIGRIVKTYKP